jgi:type II secretory pathway component PulM
MNMNTHTLLQRIRGRLTSMTDKVMERIPVETRYRNFVIVTVIFLVLVIILLIIVYCVRNC